MTNYTKTTDFAAKDSLPSGNAAKIVKGSEIDTEFNNIATASATKANANNAALTGTTTAQTLDISGNVDVDGTLETDALSLNGVTVTSTAAELNILDGVTSTAAELNILDGVTSTTAELNILDGVTSTAAELNILDGVTATTAELNYVDGVTSNVQTQLNTKAPLASPTFTGTVTAAGLTVSNSSLQVKLEEADGTNNPRLVTYFDSSGTHLQHTWSSNASNLIFEVGGSEGSGTERMRIDASGNVGIGTASPYSALTIDTANGILNVANGNTSGGTKIQAWAATPANGYLAIEGYDKEYMRVDSSGNVGIGTSSPSSYLAEGSNLVIADSSHSGITLASGATSEGGIFFADGTSGSDRFRGMIRYNHASNYMEFRTNAGENMRIDASGNLGVGVTDPGATGLSLANTFNLSWSEGTNLSYANVFRQASSAAAVMGSGYKQTDTLNKMASSHTAEWARTAVWAGYGAIKFYADAAATVSVGTDITPTERMIINSSGNVGIGTSSPSAKLAIVGTTKVGEGAASNTSKLMVNTASGTAAGIQLFQDSVESWIIQNPASSTVLTFSNSGTERMRIDASGNLLVGTTTSGYASQSGVAANPAGASYVAVAHPDGAGSGNSYALFTYNAGIIGSISQNGTTGVSYNTSSDQRLKENIAYADDAGRKVDAIQVRSFDWIADGTHQDYGMIAQELQSVAPEAVSAPEDPEEMMGVDYSKLVPMLVKEIQSLRARVAQLENN